MEKIYFENKDDNVSRKLDEKLMELHSLFELSQTLNSSLNLTAILDNMLLTPMGKMMISKGIVLLHQTGNSYKVETLKGLPQKLIGETINIDFQLSGPTVLTKIEPTNNEWISFFKDHAIELILPIRSSNKILGILGFSRKLLNTSYTKPELDFLNSLSNISATAIENGLMLKKLQEVNRKLDKKVQELNTLFDIGKELNSTLDADKIINLLSYAIMGEMMVNRCMVFIKEGEQMKLGVSKGHKSSDELIPFQQQEFLTSLFEINEAINISSATHKQLALENLQNAGFKVVVPMIIQEETKGIIAVGEKILNTDFTQDELEFLYTLGNEAIICLENARLFKETLEKQRIEEELEIAREIQQRLLPKSFPILQNYQIAAMNIPSQQVGGDYYDCIELDKDHICLAIADVSGKGIPASLLMANLQASLQAIIESQRDLSEIAARINNIIHRNTNYDKFITFFYGLLDSRENTFTSVNAGHNPPYLYHRNGSFELLEQGGLILGMLPDVTYQQQTVKLQSGDWIIMYTDGVSEAKNDKDEEFEEQRIEQVVAANLNSSAEEMMNRLYHEVKKFTAGVPQSDDITMLIIKVL